MIARLFRRTVYVRLSHDHLSVHDPATMRTLAGPAELALRNSAGKLIVAAIGQQTQAALAQEPSLRLVRPFAHPRGLVSDFVSASALLKGFIFELQRGAWFRTVSLIVMHPIGEFEGGLTQIECRVLRELGRSAGASEVWLWQGRSLSDAELLDRSFRTELAGLGLPG